MDSDFITDAMQFLRGNKLNAAVVERLQDQASRPTIALSLLEMISSCQTSIGAPLLATRAFVRRKLTELL